MRTIIIQLLLSLFLFQSGYSQKVIDLYSHLSKQTEVKLSDIANGIHYVPLETSEKCLLSNELQVYSTSDFIFIGDQLTNKFFRFDKNGKFLNQIGAKGEGDMEYANALFFFVDESYRVVNLISPQTKSIYQYTYAGEFLSKIQLSESPWMIESMGDNYVFYNNRFNRIKGNKNVKELFLINKKGMVINSLPTTITNEELDMVLFEFPFFYSYNKQLFYKNPLVDDVFQITDDFSLKKKYKIKTGTQNRRKDDYKNLKQYSKRISVRSVFENDNILLTIYAYEDNFHFLLVYKDSWKTVNVGENTPGFVDDIEDGPLFRPYWLFQSKCNSLLSILTFDEIEKQRISFDKIKTKNSFLKERLPNDNPVLVFLELK
ncbi:6-bladed beta-propeller [Massilibacteroides vaginae]|uniref:6-bladed beta-propeller n=1 Tax=Massilibacteroides vaginae TaxID=1673718 RepID=UPI001594572F|nr:6-bladed beta-propeller [Massilibacteroides vaginae]